MSRKLQAILWMLYGIPVAYMSTLLGWMYRHTHNHMARIVARVDSLK